MTNPNSKLTLEERQAQLRADIAAKKKEARRKKRNAYMRKYTREQKSNWHALRTAAQRHRAEVEARKAARLERKRLKEEAKSKREEAKRRRLKDPVAEATRIYQRGFDDGVRSITEGGLWVQKP